MKATNIVDSFLNHIFSGKMEEALSLVSPSAQFINDVDGTLIGYECAGKVKGGKITLYRFYENTLALHEALTP